MIRSRIVRTALCGGGPSFCQRPRSLDSNCLCRFNRCSVIRIFKCVLPPEVRLATSLICIQTHVEESCDPCRGQLGVCSIRFLDQNCQHWNLLCLLQTQSLRHADTYDRTWCSGALELSLRWAFNEFVRRWPSRGCGCPPLRLDKTDACKHMVLIDAMGVQLYGYGSDWMVDRVRLL